MTPEEIWALYQNLSSLTMPNRCSICPVSPHAQMYHSSHWNFEMILWSRIIQDIILVSEEAGSEECVMHLTSAAQTPSSPKPTSLGSRPRIILPSQSFALHTAAVTGHSEIEQCYFLGTHQQTPLESLLQQVCCWPGWVNRTSSALLCQILAWCAQDSSVQAELMACFDLSFSGWVTESLSLKVLVC